MKTLLIHIGYHKTATSSLQKFFYLNSKALAQAGVNYAKTGLEGFSHGELANCLKPERRNQPQSKALWAALLSEVSDSSCPVTLVSSECFLEAKDMPIVVASVLSDDVCVKLICYLRPQLEWLESVYNEIIKDPYRRYIGDIAEMRELRFGWHDYYSVLRLWSDEFGADSVSARPFQRCQLKGQSIYQDFLSVLPIQPGGDFQEPEKLNVSLHPVLTEFLRRCNQIPMLTQTHRDLVSEIQGIGDAAESFLPKTPKKFSRMPEQKAALLTREVAEINTRVAAEFANRTEPPPAENFFVDEVTEELSVVSEDCLSDSQEREILLRLSQRLTKELERASSIFAATVRGERRLPLPPKDQTERMFSVIIRQRVEMRMMENDCGRSFGSRLASLVRRKLLG